MSTKNCVIRGLLLGNSVVILDIESARKIYASGFYGKPLGVSKPRDSSFTAPLVLGLLEALYLVEKGIMCIEDSNKRILEVDRIKEHARAYVPRFDDLYIVYKHARELGYIPRSALKFGADFAFYRRGPGYEHAPFLIQVAREEEEIDPLEIVRSGRLSHSVRKSFILAVLGRHNKIKYLLFEWSKP